MGELFRKGPKAQAVPTATPKRMSGMFFDFKRCGNLVS
nr:MAG TPA: hypothetical protein [Caudoviricetes sp.]